MQIVETNVIINTESGDTFDYTLDVEYNNVPIGEESAERIIRDFVKSHYHLLSGDKELFSMKVKRKTVDTNGEYHDVVVWNGKVLCRVKTTFNISAFDGNEIADTPLMKKVEMCENCAMSCKRTDTPADKVYCKLYESLFPADNLCPHYQN